MKDIRPTYLFLSGIGASFALNLVSSAILFSRHEIDIDIFWHVTILTSLATFVFGSLPVFGGMAIIAGIVQRQTSRKSETKCLYGCLLICALLTCIGVVLLSRIDWVLADSPQLRFYLSLETAFVSAILCCLILLNLLLRRMGFQRNRFEADNFDALDEPRPLIRR